MKLFRKLKLSHQILAILLIIPTFLTLSLLYYSALQHVTIRNKPLEQIALSTSATLAEKADRNLSVCYGDVQAFAYNKLAVEALKNGRTDSNLTNFMNAMTAYYGLYDLMMLCDISGKVIATNTKDKHKNDIATTTLIGKNIGEEEWYRSSIVVGGPKGGAYYSDFNQDDDVAELYHNKGYGVNFSAPVRDEKGTIIGVWRNRVNWREITQQIRKEAEAVLEREVSGAILLLLDKQGYIIDANEEKDILKITIGKNNLFKKFDFKYGKVTINDDDYLYGWTQSRETLVHKENNWNFLTLIPKVKVTDYQIYLHSDWTGLMAFSVSLLLIGLCISLIFVRRFSKRMRVIRNSIVQLSKGKAEMIENVDREDEIGEMSHAINTLSANFKNIVNFSNEIGRGNLSATYQLLGEEDLLGNSLLQMKENLKSIELENHKQKWTAEKLAALGELLREQELPSVKFNKAISFLSKSIQAYQGVLFVVNNSSLPLMIECRAGYALSKERMDITPFSAGEGVIGQCIKENEIIRLQNLPEDYSDVISSGLGSQTPKEIIILPVRFNDIPEGALEFSSFKPFEEHSLRFLEKAAEYIGSYIAQNKINEEAEKIHKSSNYMVE